MYHVMARGNHRQSIFEDESDYEYCETLLRDVKRRMPFELHAYCFMTNHFHLLIETKDKEIWHIMKRFMQNHASYYNSKYGYIGHLFQGRYKSCMVKDDAYFLQTSRYIHQNPVKAGMVEHAEDYPWSSYRTMLKLNDDNITDRNKTLSYFGDNGILRYREFVEDVGHKYSVQENEIKKPMKEDELWLPW